MADKYTLSAAGVLVTEDGTTSVPLDPANADYARWLEATGRTHEDVLAEVAAAAEAAAQTVAVLGAETEQTADRVAASLEKIGVRLEDLRTALGL